MYGISANAHRYNLVVRVQRRQKRRRKCFVYSQKTCVICDVRWLFQFFFSLFFRRVQAVEKFLKCFIGWVLGGGKKESSECIRITLFILGENLEMQ